MKYFIGFILGALFSATAVKHYYPYSRADMSVAIEQERDNCEQDWIRIINQILGG